MDIKGIKDGLLIVFRDLAWQESRCDLLAVIAEKQAFFKGAQVVLDVGNAVLSADDITGIRDELMQQEVVLFGVLSKSLITQRAVKKLELKIELDTLKHNPSARIKPLESALSGEAALFVQKTMRSGFKVAYQGHVVVLGDVNPGAEIVATGCVVVWGHLRGTVHAGADGDHTAVVCALDLSPMQLRIGTKIAVTPQDGEASTPELARIIDDYIVAEPWQQ